MEAFAYAVTGHWLFSQALHSFSRVRVLHQFPKQKCSLFLICFKRYSHKIV